MSDAERAAPRGPAPLWSSGFRPFFLLAGMGAPALTALFAFSLLGAAPAAWGTPGWHGHEMVFGFSCAVIAGVLLTALPSWASIAEITGGRLAFLAALWLAGRAAMLCAEWLPRTLVAAADLALIPALALMLAPGLLRARDKRYLAVLGVLALLAAADLDHHLAGADAAAVKRTLQFGVDGVIVLYTLAAGVFTANFSANSLRERGRGEVSGGAALDAVAIAATLLLVLAARQDWGRESVAAAAFVACGAHAARLIGWKCWKALDDPLVWPLHLGTLWLAASLALRAAGELGLADPAAAVHAFTAGALGITMLGLMTRVALRHTGRELRVSGAVLCAYALVSASALTRMLAPHSGLAWLYPLAALGWGASFGIYLAAFGGALLGPSLPRPTQDLRM